jgi:hypothetical protein
VREANSSPPTSVMVSTPDFFHVVPGLKLDSTTGYADRGSSWFSSALQGNVRWYLKQLRTASFHVICSSSLPIIFPFDALQVMEMKSVVKCKTKINTAFIRCFLCINVSEKHLMSPSMSVCLSFASFMILLNYSNEFLSHCYNNDLGS